MATIKPGKAAQEQERLLTQIKITEKCLEIKLWNTKLERMETLKFTQEETERLDGVLSLDAEKDWVKHAKEGGTFEQG